MTINEDKKVVWDCYYSWNGYKTVAGRDFETYEGALDWAKKSGDAPYYIMQHVFVNDEKTPVREWCVEE